MSAFTSVTATAVTLVLAGSAALAAPPVLVVGPAAAQCDPCEPVVTLTGAPPREAVRLIVSRRSGDTWKAEREEDLGTTDGEGRATLTPRFEPGIYRLEVVAGGVRSQAALLERQAFCTPPVFCPPPTGIVRIGLDTLLYDRGQDVRFSVTGAKAGATLVKVRERHSAGSWVRVDKREFASADDAGEAEGFAPADEPGLFRLFVEEKGRKARTPPVLYEVGTIR